MAIQSFFLKDIEQEGFRNSLTKDDQKTLDQYLHDIKTGLADGEMDIEMYESMRGYYGHLEIVYAISDLEKKAAYLKNLLIDIDAWLERKPNDYVITRVRNMIASKEF